MVHTPCPLPAPNAICPWPGWVWLRTIQGFLMKVACCSCANPPPFNQSRPASQRSGRKPQPLEQGGQRAGREASYSIIYLEQAPPDFVSQDASPMRCSVYKKEMPRSIKGEKCCNSEHLFHYEVHPTLPAISEKSLK